MAKLELRASRTKKRPTNTADTHNLIASDPETRRALEIDTLAAILPMDRRDRLAELLTDDDVATLTHLAREGIGANTLAGACLRSGLSRNLGLGCSVGFPPLAGPGSADLALHRPASLGD